jgi:xanthine dehydrogenase YagS FAD-binding subunit
MNPFEWVDATTVAEALAQLGPNAMLKAGGVDVMDLLKERLIEPKRLVNLRTIAGLDRISDKEGEGLRIAPLATLARIAAEPAIARRYRALADAAGHAATPQIRNMATAAGNLVQRPRCWYFRQEAFHCRKKGGDHCFAIEGENQYHAIFGNSICAAVHPSALGVALVALGGKLELTSAKGKREIAVESFFTRPEDWIQRENVLLGDEIITEIRVPEPKSGASSAYLKQGEKESFDWPLVEVAVAVEREGGGKISNASVVLGAVAHTPHRARGAEQVLIGRHLTESTAREAGQAAIERASPLSGNAYKLQLVQVMVRRAILAAKEVPS